MRSLTFKRLILYPVQAAAVYLLFYVFRAIPLDTASALGGKIGQLVGPRFGVHEKARRNLLLAFPDLSRNEQDSLLQAMWDNLGRVFAEYPHLTEIGDSRVQINSQADLQAVQGKPALVVSGHFANWEVMPVYAAKIGLPLQLVYRHANNPYVDRLLRRARTPMGEKLARKGVQGALSVHGALRAGGAVGMLIDQKHTRGLSIPFFGRPAQSAPAVAELALKYDAPIILCLLERTHGAHFKLTVLPPLALPEMSEAGLPQEQKVLAMLAHLHGMIEAHIRAHPAQYLWLHRRWG